jgi:hypothetical protein
MKSKMRVSDPWQAGNASGNVCNSIELSRKLKRVRESRRRGKKALYLVNMYQNRKHYRA